MASLITSTSSMEVVRSSGLVPPLPLMSDTEDAVLEESSELDDPETLDLSTHGLTKLSRAAPGYDLTTMTLLLDNNSLQRLDNIHTYQCLEKLSACNNELVRMSQVCKLNHLKILNLSNNNIEFMDGLKELKLLSWLGLANNKIKSIQQLNQCVHLEHLDLSGNFIQHLSDLSYLKNLKVLLLHRNNIETLRSCDRFLPTAISTLTLNGNDLTDLTELSFLTGLLALEQLTLADNPCILQPEEESKQYDYRPYVINWCLGLRVLDGVIVRAKESLKAEWMYSQSKGRHFNVGQHEDLLVYLLSVCPLHPGEDWEEDKKLNLILSKVQEHQQSLREPGSGAMSPRCNTLTRSYINSPMRGNSRKNSAASSASTTPTATPLAPRRSSFTFAQQQRSSLIRRSSLNRTSPSPVRRRTMTPGRASSASKQPPSASSASYALALPRSLYGDDINGNTNMQMMTQSMDPAHLAARLDNNTTPTVLTHQISSTSSTPMNPDLMTASLDPTILRDLEPIQMKGLPEAWSKESPPALSTNVSRPSSLFQSGSNVHHEAANMGQDLKDLYLQDLSDGELTGQSLMYTRLQSRLNTVPESLNSPDMAPLNLGQRPPAKDDPIRVYNRDLAISSSTVSTTSSSSTHQQANKVQSAQQKPATSSKKDETNNGYSSSSDDHPAASTTGSTATVTPTTSAGTSGAAVATTTVSAVNKTNQQPQLKTAASKKEGSVKKSPQALSGQQRIQSKPKATPTKIRPPPQTNKNLIKKPQYQSSKQVSDTSRLSRTASKDDRTDQGEDESSQSEASIQDQKDLKRVRKVRKTRRPSQTDQKYAPEKYSDRETGRKKRPNSATPMMSRPRSNTLSTPLSSNSASNSAVVAATPVSGNKSSKSPRAHSAAMTVQKNWRGHLAKERDAEKVSQLKEEVRNLRTEEHIKHLTKELANAKQALERERKLRALQMDAIKVLWKEVQLMDEARSSSSVTVEQEVTRPSGRGGSKISSRSSEHSIAKLMETLQATAGVTPASGSASLKKPQDSGVVSMAQSMPASVLCGQLNSEVTAVESLSKTCNSLQNQVEQLQSSLAGVMQFMSNFQPQDQGPQPQRQRHSSNESSSFSYFQPIQMTQSCIANAGPMSLPLNPVVIRPPVIQHQPCENSCLATSRSCDCLTQTDISAVLTPRNEQMPPDPPAAQLLQFKRVDISLETSDSEATSSGRLRMPSVQHLNEHQSRLLLQKDQAEAKGARSRSKSPRPQTLPGLVKASESQVALRPDSPQTATTAPAVKKYAENLIEGIICDTISKALSEDDKCNDQETDVSLSLATEDTKDTEEDAVQASADPIMASQDESEAKIKSPASHVETDSLDESEHAGQHS